MNARSIWDVHDAGLVRLFLWKHRLAIVEGGHWRAGGAFVCVAPNASAPVDCRDIRIENCHFDFNGYTFTASEVGFSAGVFLGGQISGLHVVGNSFTRNERPLGSDSKYEYGCLHTSTTQVVSFDANGTSMVSSLWSSLENAVFRNNEFYHLTAAVLVYAECTTSSKFPTPSYWYVSA